MNSKQDCGFARSHTKGIDSETTRGYLICILSI